MYVPNVMMATPDTKILFSDIRKIHYSYVLSELDTRQVNFNRTKMNSKGKSVKIGIKELVNILRSSVCPNEEAQKISMSKEQ